MGDRRPEQTDEVPEESPDEFRVFGEPFRGSYFAKQKPELRKGRVGTPESHIPPEIGQPWTSTPIPAPAVINMASACAMASIAKSNRTIAMGMPAEVARCNPTKAASGRAARRVSYPSASVPRP